MTTLYLFSRGYFRLRATLQSALRSPFLQAGAVAFLTFLALGRFDQTPGAGVHAAVLPSTPAAVQPPAAAPADERLLAWSILAARGSRGSAERAALEHLYRLDEPLDGLSFNDPTLNMSGLDLGGDAHRGASLRGVGFAGVNLSGARLAGADLYAADFTGADLSGADLAYAKLASASLIGADLAAASLRRAELDRARLDGVAAPAIDLRDASLMRVDAVGARLDGALAMTSDWRGSDLSAASLAGADFTGARLDHARFDGADISGASFFGAIGLDTASFSRSWAWADTPPVGLPAGVRVELCNPGVRSANRRAYFSTGSGAAGEAGRRPPHC